MAEATMTRRPVVAVILASLLTLVVALLAGSAPAPKLEEAARLNNIGVAYMNQQLFEKALKSFEAAAQSDPFLEVVTVNEGVALLNLQRLDEAKALLDRAAKTNPKDPHVWYNLGLFYKNSSDGAAAVDAFRHVIEIDANDADSWYLCADEAICGSDCGFRARFETRPSSCLRAIRLSARLPAVRTIRRGARGDEEVSVRHTK